MWRDSGDAQGAREMISAVNEVELEKLNNRQNMEKLLTALKGRIFLSGNADPEDTETTGPGQKFADGREPQPPITRERLTTTLRSYHLSADARGEG